MVKGLSTGGGSLNQRNHFYFSDRGASISMRFRRGRHHNRRGFDWQPAAAAVKSPPHWSNG
jgi:hypothetical protein